MALRYILVCITSFSLFVLLSCNTKQSASVPTFQDTLLQYLKNDLGIFIDTTALAQYYKTGLRAVGKSLLPDSLLVNNTEVTDFPSNGIRLLAFTNGLYSKSDGRKNGYTIHLIQDVETGKFYVDWVDDLSLFHSAGSFCGYIFIKLFGKEENENIKLTDISNFNAIPSERIFADHELQPLPQKRGLEQLLNARYRYDKINDAELDSMFKCYNQLYFFPLTVVKNVSGLLALMSEFKNKITSQYNGTDRKQRLLYLKDQFSLLLLKQKKNRVRRISSQKLLPADF